MKKIILIAMVLVVVVAIGVLVKGRRSPDRQNGEDEGRETSNILPDISQKIGSRGVSLSPKSFSGNDFQDFFAKANDVGDIISWAGDWQELANTEKGGPVVVTSLSAQYRYTPVIEVQFFTQSTGKLLRPLSESMKADYKKAAVNFAKKWKPPYMGLGIEINILYERSPADFEAFTKFFSEVYDAVKEVSPKTKVFTIFQLEKMKGLHGGLFGGANDPSKNEWDLIEKFPKADLVAFTTYPSLIYKTPSEIPDNYYREITLRITKPVAFTEIGWPSDAAISGWESNEEDQSAFIKKYFFINQGFKHEFDIWSFLYDQQTIEPFTSMGLIGKNGALKRSMSEWAR